MRNEVTNSNRRITVWRLQPIDYTSHTDEFSDKAVTRM